jgi:hypothetical protein
MESLTVYRRLGESTAFLHQICEITKWCQVQPRTNGLLPQEFDRAAMSNRKPKPNLFEIPPKELDLLGVQFGIF